MIENEKVEDIGDDPLFSFREIIVDPKQKPMRLDKYLMKRLEAISRNRVQAVIKEGYILVDDKEVKANYNVRPNEVISVKLPKNPDNLEYAIPEDIPLDVVYEDEHVMVINKPPGLVVHPGTGNHSGTLVNALVHHFKDLKLPILEGNSAKRPGIVHRIDKDTSGLMVIAKTDDAMTHLGKQFFDHTIEREYIALVWSEPEADVGKIVGNIGRSPTDRMQMIVFPDGDYGKPAVTHYEVLERMYYVTLVKCKLETGRTHQIRVHMKYIGNTLFNDERYGGNRVLKGTIFSKYKRFVENCFDLCPRQALHAASLGFIHPVSGEKMYFEQPLPEDFSACLDKWRKYRESRQQAL